MKTWTTKRNHRESTWHQNVSCSANSQGKALTAVSNDHEDLQHSYYDMGKSSKRPKHMTTCSGKDGLGNLPQWNQRSKWTKEHERNLKDGELIWLVDNSGKR